jgi:gliding motility-associated-like protein
VPWTAVSGAISSDYLPGVLNVTTDFRRKVISSACFDFSNIITITAHSPVLNNTVSLLSLGSDTTLCNGENPNRLIGSVPTGGINSFAYLWLSSNDNATWNQIPLATARDYDPISLSAPTYFKRQVTSGACVVVSSSTVNVNVLPLITNNTITGDASVCKNLIPAPVTGAVLSGGAGSGSYTYSWQQSTDGGVSWKAASDVNNNADYQPPALSIPVKYRRFVTSGLKNTCKSTSNVYDISIDPLPVSQIDAGKDDQLFSIRKKYQLKAAAPVTGESGTWTPLNNSVSLSDPKSNSAVAENLSFGTNTFIWTVERTPCKLSDTVNIVVKNDLFPQGFSPNGDSYNNEFIIEGLDPELNYVDLKIINGAGTEVYKISNRSGLTSLSWDGKNQKGIELPEGTYYYMLKLTSRDGKGSDITKSGFIILKRY